VTVPSGNRYRNAWAGALRSDRVGEELHVAGWVHRRRDHGGVIFVDLRDREGLLQLVFHPESAREAHEAAGALRAEDVISAAGELVQREEGTVNPGLPTGEVELAVSSFDLLAGAQTPPFQIDADEPVGEELRLRHRYLDLRRPELAEAMALRHRVVSTIRSRLEDEGFLEVETPMLTRSTPEGARDYLVPNRRAPGTWYALPQSPQLFKQLLMVAGFERYYQIVRCFRDEDLRADRQPEFTQLDLEMSFVEEEDVIGLIEEVMTRVFEAAGLPVAPAPWLRLTYDQAMLRYGTDRPDLRFGLEIEDLSEAFAATEFRVFASVLGAGGVVRGVNAGARELSRAELDGLTEEVRRAGAGGLVWAFVQEDGSWRSPARGLSDAERADVGERLGAAPGDLLLLVADQPAVAASALGELRLAVARRFDLVPADRHELLWVVDFPAFEWNAGERRWDAVHHPFTAPVGDFADPGAMRSRAYDIVMSGTEIGGGSIRINRPDVQQQVFTALGISEEEAGARFGFLLDALRYGAPPHGGIALGVDRIVALIAGRESIRDVIAFPKTASGGDPLTGAPAPVDGPQLSELGLRVTAPPAP